MPLAPPPVGEVVRGWMDLDLSRKGENEAQRLARDLKGRGLAMLYSSDLERAVETAEILEKSLGIPLLGTSSDLRTWGLGELEGAPLKDAQQIIHEYVNKRPNAKPKGGESFNDFIRTRLRKIQQIHDVTWPKKIAAGIVTHHWVIEIAKAWIDSGAKPDFSMNKQGLFIHGQEPPGSVFDVWEELDAGKLRIKKIDVQRGGYQFKPGPVLIRHASTSWNVGGKG